MGYVGGTDKTCQPYCNWKAAETQLEWVLARLVSYMGKKGCVSGLCIYAILENQVRKEVILDILEVRGKAEVPM